MLQRGSHAPIAEKHAESTRCPRSGARARLAIFGWTSLSVYSRLNIRWGRVPRRPHSRIQVVGFTIELCLPCFSLTRERYSNIGACSGSGVKSGETDSCADIWREKRGHEERVSCDRYGVGALYTRRRQVAQIPHNGADRHMFFGLCWLSRQHGAHQ
jgi:hypothetical protein